LNVFEQILKVGVFIGCVDCASKLLGIWNNKFFKIYLYFDLNNSLKS
jgi:hypothetical protein